MTKVLIAFLALGVILAAWSPKDAWAASDDDPLYQGKLLSEWVKMLQDPNPDVRLKALGAIKHVRRAEAAVPALIEALKDKDSYVREDTAYALGHIGPRARKAIPALIDTLTKDKDLTVRERAADALGKIGPEDATVVPALAEALKEKDVRLRAAKALERMGPQAKEAVPALVEMIKEPAPPKAKKPLARLYAVEALAAIGPDAKEAVPTLVNVLKDKDSSVREAAADALKKIDPDAASSAGVP